MMTESCIRTSYQVIHNQCLNCVFVNLSCDLHSLETCQRVFTHILKAHRQS